MPNLCFIILYGSEMTLLNEAKINLIKKFFEKSLLRVDQALENLSLTLLEEDKTRMPAKPLIFR